jgi:dipeptidyl aminopeptidase/acylaminoacyl peptidase
MDRSDFMLPTVLLLFAATVAAQPAPGPAAVSYADIGLEQIMADPDWIGPPVEHPRWMLDGSRVLFQLKRDASPIRDLYEYSLHDGRVRPVLDPALETLDGPDPVYDRAIKQAAFVRNGDVFVRDLGTGALTQVSRGAGTAQDLRFQADGGGVYWRSEQDWFGWRFSDPVVMPLARLKAENDPQAEPEDDAARDRELRLIATLAREQAEREARREFDAAVRAADATRAPEPIYLGDKVEIVSSSLSPSSRWLLVVTRPKDAEPGRAGTMPRYVTESGYEEVEEVRTRVGRNPPIAQGLHLVEVATGRIRELPLDPLPGITDDPLADLRKAAGQDPLDGLRPVRLLKTRWSDDGERVAVMLRAIDNKDRWIALVDLDEAALIPAHRLTDPAWINDAHGSRDNGWDPNLFGWLPDGRALWMLSEHSGYAHLYTLVPGKRPRALTEGAWEVAKPVLSPDGATFYFMCNRAWPGDRELCARDLAGGPVRELTALDGVEGFVLSADGRRVALRYSGTYLPPQLALLDLADGAVQAITDTRKPAYRAIDWLEPEYVAVPSRHGADAIPAKLYKPAKLEPGKRYPVVLFVHGAGYLQSVHARWPHYFREQMFHNLLVANGYIVLDMDYRGSAGYGRDWRTAIYRQMGHPELEDYLDGLEWLVEHHQGDRARVGIHGGSYGGFMAFMALFRAPGVFHAGAALRPVTDWTSYAHGYTANILNTPDIDPEAYRKSSPIEYAEALEGHLLISHGMLDDNVFYQDSVRLAQRLIELRKDHWELASYPLERHAYVRPESWFDQYRRVFRLFERALKPKE